jgi:hypothetical protein
MSSLALILSVDLISMYMFSNIFNLRLSQQHFAALWEQAKMFPVSENATALVQPLTDPYN